MPASKQSGIATIAGRGRGRWCAYLRLTQRNIRPTYRRRRRVTRRMVRLGTLLVVGLTVGLVINPTHTTRTEKVPQLTERKATMEEKGENKTNTRLYARALGYNQQQVRCLVKLWMLESRFDHHARPRDNKGRLRSSAYGIAQLLGEKSDNPSIQILRGIRYITHRYQSFCSALRFHNRNGWY